MKTAGHETVLAFDFGHKRLGLAVGGTVSGNAEALGTVAVRHGRADWTRVAAVVTDWQPDRFVVGLPVHADGTRHTLAAAVERFARQLSGRFQRPIEFVDERLSSQVAAQRAGARRHGIDALAAQAILETWLGERARLRAGEDRVASKPG